MKSIIHICFLLFTLLFNNAFATITHKTVAEILPQYKEYVKKARESWKAPGVAIAIIENGQVTFISNGVSKVGGNDPITEDSIFCIMSCSKVITVSVLQKLVDEGKISLEDKVTDYIPWFKIGDKETTAKVKVKHLISHCIGLPPFSGDTFSHLDYSQKEIIDILGMIPLKYPVGEKYGYQNVFVGIAGLLVEQVTGKSLDVLMNEYIFEKLEMQRSSVGPDLPGIWARILQFFKKDRQQMSTVCGHRRVHDQVVVSNSKYQYVFSGTSGVHSCTRDYIKLVACLINGGVIEFGPHKGERLFSERAWQTMSSPQISIGHIRDDNIQFPVVRMKKKSFYYGNGMFGMQYGENERFIRALSHMGAGTGWRSIWFAVPEHKVGIVIFSNYGSNSTNLLPEALTYQFLDMYFGFSDNDWSAAILKKHLRTKKFIKSQYDSYVLGPAIKSNLVIGEYKNDLYGTLSVKEKNDTLWINYRKRNIPLKHIGGPVFELDPNELSSNFCDDDYCNVYFVTDKKTGTVTGVEISQLREGDKIFKK
ncbi:MAG: beta-lactamase family protein [Holosporales bacterium]|jgi:CubicO group peptidase (beta-lactamase class C family)|nr:beta-lactamase family protein [Holosporales bacterium]